MKAVAVVPGSRTIRIVDHEPPELKSPAAVRLRMLEVGVCGTDKEICAFEYGSPPAGSDYLILGHEALGEVVEVGPDVSSVKAGDLVVPMVRRPCPHESCIACRAGRSDFCYTGDFTERGIKEAHGFLTEFVVDRQLYMVPVPAALREVGILVEPLTIAMKALTQVAAVQDRLPWGEPSGSGQANENGKRAVVLGAGPVGLLGAMALRATGFSTFVYSREPESSPKAELTAAIGANYVSAANATVEELAGQVGEVDVVYEAAGASRLSFEMLRYLGTNGVFVFTGVPGRKAPIELDADLLMRNLVLKNQLVFGTVNADRASYEAAVRQLAVFLQRWPDAVRGLITGHYEMEAYEDLLLGHAGGIKNVFKIGDRP